MRKIKGQLLRADSYKTYPNKGGGCKVTLPRLSGINPGENVYIEKHDSGIILIIPESVYNEAQNGK